MAVTPFHTYVVGAERPAGLYLTRALAQENLFYKAVSLEGHERLSEQSSGHPFFVLLPSLAVPGDLDAAEYWVNVANEHDAPVVLLSSLQVFGGAGTGENHCFSEDDPVVTDSPLNERLLALEEYVRERCSRHLIVRCGAGFSLHPGDFSHQLLAAIRDGRSVELDDEILLSPTPDEDTADVIIAMIKQADCTDTLWGTYHFAGSDPVTLYDFGEALVAEASQYEDLSDINLIQGESDTLLAQLPACGDGTRLLHYFGIQSKVWRKGLSRVIGHHYRGNK